jgi:hypothetical protein
MAKKENRPYVLLTTVPNGYAMTVDGKEYMAFDVEGMQAQVFTHIALHEKEYLSASFVKALFEVAGTWPDHKDAYTALADQIAIVKDQQKTINHLYKRLSDMGKDKDDVEKKLTEALEQVEKYANRVEELARNLVKRDEEIAALKMDIEEESIVIKSKRAPRKKKTEPKTEPKTATEKKAKVKELKKEKEEKEKEAKTARAAKQHEYNEAHKPEKKSTAIVKIPYSRKAYNALMTPLTIDKLGLPTKTINILRIAGAKTGINHTIADIAGLTRKQLLLTRGCGNIAADEIETWLEKHGLALHMDVKAILEEHQKQLKQIIA